MGNVGKFLIQNRKGVKKMKKIFVYILCAMFLATVSNIAEAGTGAPVTVTATVASASRDIVLTPTSLTWNIPAGTITAHHSDSPTMTVTFYGGNETGGYKIRSYTQNATAGDGRGYLVKGSDKLYLKIWCPNFGPGYARINPNDPPNANNTYMWEGYDFNGDGDKTDTGQNGSLTAGAKYVEATLGFDINGDDDTLDTIEVAAKDANPDTFVYDGANAKYWLGESPSYSWTADKPTLTTYEVVLCNDVNPLASGFKVAFGADVQGVVAGTYTAAGTGVMFDIVARI
jgi:hypothetical protein